MKRTLSIGSIVTCLIAITAPVVDAQVTFSEVADSAGVSRTGETYGVSWGDVNGDGLPDLWVGNHADTPSLFVNQGDGTFSDQAALIWPGNLGDMHGAAWADFDNDGDQDLFNSTGSQQSNQLYVNEAGIFVEQAVALGADQPGSRSRSVTWADWNRDGFLDVFVAHALGPAVTPVIMSGSLSGFSDSTAAVGLSDLSFVATYLGDLSGDGLADFLLSSGNQNAGPLFDASMPVWSDLAAPGSGLTFAGNFGCTDSVIADLTGDGQTDIFSVCGTGLREVNQDVNGAVEAQLSASASEVAVEFVTDAPVTIDVYPRFVFDTDTELTVGDSGYQPTIAPPSQPAFEAFQIVLDPAESGIGGMPVYQAGIDQGLFIGYDDQQDRWSIAFSSPGALTVAIVVTPESGSEITDISTIGFLAEPIAVAPFYQVRSGNEFVDNLAASGLDQPMSCVSAAGGDFDNDMDIDLYLLCSRSIRNLPNLLLLNDGAGNFSAAGPVAEGTADGSGDSVAVADYDQDGFLDLFVTNGWGGVPFNDGPNQLFRNDGNTNNWVQFELVGSTSNRDAIGSIIRVTAGGVEQTRMLTGGMRRRAQDFNRAHFGLAANEVIEQIEIQWVSGAVSQFSTVEPNRTITIQEDGSSDIDGDGVIDADDAYPADAFESADNDGDGIGDNADTDDDGDGLPDTFELANALDPLDPSDAAADPDADKLDNLAEFAAGTNPQSSDSDGDGFSDGIEVDAGTSPTDAASVPDSGAEDPAPAPAPSSSGGGGGVIGLPMLLLSLAALRRRRIALRHPSIGAAAGRTS